MAFVTLPGSVLHRLREGCDDTVCGIGGFELIDRRRRGEKIGIDNLAPTCRACRRGLLRSRLRAWWARVSWRPAAAWRLLWTGRFRP